MDEQTAMAWGHETYTLPWHGIKIRAVTLADGRDMRMLKDLGTALMMEESTLRKRLRAEPRWAARSGKFSGLGERPMWLVERRIVKGLLYSLNPYAPRPDIAPDLDALKDEMDGVLDAAAFTSRCPELAAILGSLQPVTATYSPDIHDVPARTPDRDQEILQRLTAIDELVTEQRLVFAALVEIIRGKRPIPPVLRASLYQAAWELQFRVCVGCGLTLFEEDGRPRLGVMTLHHLVGLVSIASNLMPLCAHCNYLAETDVDVQQRIKHVDNLWVRNLWTWSHSYPAIRQMWAVQLRNTRNAAQGQQRWLRWRHLGDHEHYDQPGDA